MNVRRAEPRIPVRMGTESVGELADEPIGEDRPADVAAFAGTSPFHLCRHFASVMSISPHQYLLNVRISRAKEMLERSRDSDLTSIAQLTGFYDQAHFVKSFRSEPGSLRQRIGNSSRRAARRAPRDRAEPAGAASTTRPAR